MTAPDPSNAPAGGPAGKWTDRLLAEGADPDPRFTLANERTFLAWIRTALAMIAGGIGLALSGRLMAAPLRDGLAAGFSVVGALIAAMAFRRWLRTERALRRAETLPLPTFAPVISYGLAVVSVTLVAALLATR
ncbi:YidH family protein [Spirillospora sp. NPDC048911]|uniref:YidH family protein n=1 Tax=Spirillospora sp. NPDC048911 TaxID=3364527 RepID=UPI0037185702